MNGPEHYREAETLLALATDADAGARHRDVAMLLRFAQVHATLAVAAASVDAQRGGTRVWAEYPEA